MKTLREIVEHQAPDVCQWFALCENKATTSQAHPVLGSVPICERCAAKLANMENGNHE